MAPKKPAAVATPPSTTTTKITQTSSTSTSQSVKTTSTSTSSTTSAVPSSTPSAPSSSTSQMPSSLRNAQDAQAILEGIWSSYVQRTSQRTKLLDTFMAFLVTVGVLQFVYCVIGGNYPFNAFLAGFSATVGQFVLTASLRIQTNPENVTEFAAISHERAFADYVFGSMILHFFCVNFIN